MPYDRSYDEDEDKRPDAQGTSRRFQDFDCPDCSANNPWDDGFGNGDEIRCYYCGQEYLAQVTEEGRLKLRAL
jgi:DNA-directed RNA polymerase subunit RPC12/RpoP